MTHADHLRIHRLPGQLDLVRARLAQLDRTPRLERNRYWRERYAAAPAKRKRLLDRAQAYGLRDIVREATA